MRRRLELVVPERRVGVVLRMPGCLVESAPAEFGGGGAAHVCICEEGGAAFSLWADDCVFSQAAASDERRRRWTIGLQRRVDGAGTRSYECWGLHVVRRGRKLVKYELGQLPDGLGQMAVETVWAADGGAAGIRWRMAWFGGEWRTVWVREAAEWELRSRVGAELMGWLQGVLVKWPGGEAASVAGRREILRRLPAWRSVMSPHVRELWAAPEWDRERMAQLVAEYAEQPLDGMLLGEAVWPQVARELEGKVTWKATTATKGSRGLHRELGEALNATTCRPGYTMAIQDPVKLETAAETRARKIREFGPASFSGLVSAIRRMSQEEAEALRGQLVKAQLVDAGVERRWWIRETWRGVLLRTVRKMYGEGKRQELAKFDKLFGSLNAEGGIAREAAEVRVSDSMRVSEIPAPTTGLRRTGTR